MRGFLRDVAVFAALQLAIGTLLLLRYPGAENTYLAATLDKHARAAGHAPPRILFVGGSSVAFGIDSPAVEAALGRHPLNLGLHAAVGLDFMLNEARSVMRPGDVVVVSLEYEHFLEDQTSPVLLDLLEFRPRSIAFVSAAQARTLLDQGLVWLRTVGRRALRSAPRDADAPGYSREAFNAYGDVVGHHAAPRLYQPEPTSPRFRTFATGPIRRAARALATFARDAREADVTVRLLYPPLAAPEFRGRRAFIEATAAVLARELDVPRLNAPEDAAYPVKLFYDTPYHLTREGKARHTGALVVALASSLGRTFAGPP